MIEITRGNTDNGEPSLTIKLTNGDLRLYESVMEKWRFASGVGFLRFVFSIMSKAQSNRVTIVDETTGRSVSLEPADSLLQIDGSSDNGATSANPESPTTPTQQ